MEARGKWRCGPRQCEPDVRVTAHSAAESDQLELEVASRTRTRKFKFNDLEVRDSPGLKAPSPGTRLGARGGARQAVLVPLCQAPTAGQPASSVKLGPALAVPANFEWHSAQQRAGTLS